MKQIKEIYDKYIAKYIDVKYLITKVFVLMFSGLISIAPIFFVALADLNEKLEGKYNVRDLLKYIKTSEDLVYALVGLSTIVLADVLGREKSGGILKRICGLSHILTILFGSLLYAHYKTHEIVVNTVGEFNSLCTSVVLGLSVLSYINLAVIVKNEEVDGDE